MFMSFIMSVAFAKHIYLVVAKSYETESRVSVDAETYFIVELPLPFLVIVDSYFASVSLKIL